MPGQLGMEPGAHFQQTRHAASQMHAPGGRLRDAAQDFEQRAFARAIPANDAHHLAPANLKGYVAQGPEVFGGSATVPVAFSRRRAG